MKNVSALLDDYRNKVKEELNANSNPIAKIENFDVDFADGQLYASAECQILDNDYSIVYSAIFAYPTDQQEDALIATGAATEPQCTDSVIGVDGVVPDSYNGQKWSVTCVFFIPKSDDWFYSISMTQDILISD
ncbi:hypothetical protein KFE98_05325 [bacterium SCSIO 12741]|nr:hypothetical protein KFE98_05325 [bacterium SCSIO 12741]